MKIAEVLNLPTATIVDHTFGELISVGDYERKNRPDGEEYTCQAFTIRDDGVILVGTIYDHYPLDEYLNKVLYFCSMRSRNGRFGGVSTFKQESGNIFTRDKFPVSIRVSKAGAIHTPDSFKALKRK